MTKSEYIQKHIRRVKLFEREFTRRMYSEIRKPMMEVAEVLQSNGIEAARNRAEKIMIVEGIGKSIQNIYVTVGVWAAKKVVAQVNKDIKDQKAGFGYNERWVQDILNYFKYFLLSKAVLPISETTKKDILEILIKGQTEGWGIDKMVFELEGKDMPLSRARTIVRTEIAKARFFGHELGKQDLGFKTVDKWISAHDARTRHSHREVDGQVIEEGGRFRVARYKSKLLVGYDMMIGPGDPDASPENVINCRCTKVTRLARDENGKLIRKSKISVILPDNRPKMPVITI